MPIEWVPIFSAALKGAATGSTARAAGLLIEKVKGRVFLSELELALDKALDEAQKRDEKLVASQHLFYRCNDRQQKDFFGKVMESSLLLEELQKPIENNGSINQDALKVLFQQVATELKVNLVDESLPGWIEAFANNYFKQTTASIRFQVAKGRYLESLEQRVDDVKFVGIDVPGEEVERQGQLEKIFVMPDVRLEVTSSELQQYWQQVQASKADSSRLNHQEDLRRIEPEPMPRVMKASDIFSFQPSRQKAVLLGVPGSGKSTLIDYFALMICQGLLSNIGLDQGQDQDWLPIVIRIRNWALQPQQNILDYCRSFAEDNLCAGQLPPAFFEHWLERGQAVILLDGLDEVASEVHRKEIAEKIDSFVGRHKKNPTLITSRLIGYRRDFFDENEFTHHVLEELDRPRIEIFINNWYSSRIPDLVEAKNCKDSLRKALDEKPQILQLAGNPLLITMIALIHRYRADLPRQRHKLYEQAVSTLIVTWNTTKYQEFASPLRLIQPNDLLYIMRKVAFHVHSMNVEQNGEVLISRENLIIEISKAVGNLSDCLPHNAKKEAEWFVKFIQERTGLLNEQGRDQYGFVHKTFQEYLTAAEVYSQFETGDNNIIFTTIQTYLHQPHWREVLLLLVAMLKGKRAEDAIQLIFRAKSRHEKWLHRDLLFAARCLTENPEEMDIRDQGLANNILKNIFKLESDGINRFGKSIEGEIIKIFQSLVGTRFQNNALTLLEKYANVIKRDRYIRLQHSLGNDQINVWLSHLKQSNLSASAISALSELGNNSEMVITELLLLCENPTDVVRHNAALLLGRLGNSSEPVITTLISLCKDQELVCSSAVKALGKLGNNSEPVIKMLLSLLNNYELNINSKAASSLVKLGDNSEKVIETLFTLLQNIRPHLVHPSVAKSLGKLRNNSEQIFTKLFSLLEVREEDFIANVALALGELGNSSESVITELLSLCQNKREIVRTRAAEALGKLGDNSEKVIAMLLYLCQDPVFEVRFHAARALGKLGDSSEPVITILLSLCKDNDAVSPNAARALGQLGDISEPVITALLSLLTNPDNFVRFSAAEALYILENKSKQIVLPKIEDWLCSQQDIREEVIDLLRKLID